MEKVRLGDIFVISSGGTPNKKVDIYYKNGNIPWIKTGDLKQKYVSDDIEFITEEGLKNSSAKLFPRETVLIAMYGATIGACSILPYQASTNQACAAFLPNDMILPDYLYYFLCSQKEKFIKDGVGGAQPNISAGYLKNVLLQYRNLSEQKNIINQLNYVTDIIDKRKEQLSKLDELVKARFVELFGDININDKGWDIEPLGNLCDISRGGSPRPIENYLGGDVPWIKIGDATKGDNVYLHATKEHIIQEGVKKSRLVKKGSLIFANCGVSLGFARIITFDGCIHDGWLAMENIDNRLDKVFLLQALNQMTEHFRAIAPAGTQPNLNTAIMKAYMQIIPPIELQKDYIAFVEQTDKSKLAIQKSLEKLELLKKALMQKYFG